jgi:hypothetical protein
MRVKSSEKIALAISLFGIALLPVGGYWWEGFNEVPSVEIPEQKLPSPNAFDIYMQAFALHRRRPLALYEDYNLKSGNFEEQPYKPWEEHLPFYRKPQLQAWLASNQSAIKTLRAGFKYEFVHPPIDVRNSPPFDCDLAGEFSRTLSAASWIYAARGDWNRAATVALDALRLGQDYERGGNGITPLVASAIQSSGRRPLELMLRHLDAKTCRMAARRRDGNTPFGGSPIKSRARPIIFFLMWNFYS